MSTDGIKRRSVRRTVVAAVGVAVAAALAGCGSAAAPPRVPTVVTRGVAARVPVVSPRPYGAADTAFGLGLLGAWCRQDPTANIVFSPASLATGLGLAYLGARGATQRAMAGVLHVPAAGPALLAGLHARTAALDGLSGPGVTVRQSNAVWADPGLTTSRRFLNAAATGYGAGLRRVPLLRRPSHVVGQINAAIAAATGGHIRRLLKPGSLSGDIGWVLTDALYLNARWATPFEPDGTSPGPFTTAARRHVTATYMSGTGFPYVRVAGWTAVELPYRGRRLAMTALLPDSGAGGCPDLTAAALSQVTAGLRRAAVGQRHPASASRTDQAGIKFPKISLSTAQDMAGLLTQLGMGRAFSPAADFAGLSPQACCIKLIRHAATLQVTEKGTVATAATAGGIESSSAPYEPHIVVFNRPYVLLITDPATGEPLFVARIADAAVRSG